MDNRYKLLAACLVALTLAACGPAPSQKEESCSGTNCTEAGINAPVGEQPPPSTPSTKEEPDPGHYAFPAFDPSWELARESYDKMQDFYDTNYDSIQNKRYAIIVDFRQHSSKKRFYLFDLANGTVERHVTAHGANSDPDNDGFATIFSNTIDSKQSSLGFYFTLATYNGSHGYSMRLRGISETNSNAETRAIVMHPADYVSDSASRAGRSWGCPALDPKISKSVIDRVKLGALILIDR